MSDLPMKITNRQMQVLRGVPDTHMAADYIADGLREETHWIASPLKALERKGLIVCTHRGGRGLPSFWKRTAAGQSAIAGIKP